MFLASGLHLKRKKNAQFGSIFGLILMIWILAQVSAKKGFDALRSLIICFNFRLIYWEKYSVPSFTRFKPLNLILRSEI